MSKQLVYLGLIVGGVACGAGVYFLGQTTSIPVPIASQPTDAKLGEKACGDVRRVINKIFESSPHAAYLAAPDVKTLFTCRLYEGLGEKAGALVQTNVTFASDRIRAEAVVDLSKLDKESSERRLGSWGATVLSQIAFKTRKNPFMKDKTVFLAIEGQPIVSDRRFVLYATPTVQLGKWQFSLKEASKYFRIPEIYLREWLRQEYLVPMEPSKISLEGNLLKLEGSRTAW